MATVMSAFEHSTVVALTAVGVPEPARLARTVVALVDGFMLQHLANPRADDEQRLREALDTLVGAAVTKAVAPEAIG
jgi:nucleoside permease NupC